MSMNALHLLWVCPVYMLIGMVIMALLQSGRRK